MYLFDVDNFLVEVLQQLRNESPDVFNVRQIDLFEKLARDLLAKGQTNHAHGHEAKTFSPGEPMIGQGNGQRGQGRSTSAPMRCPGCNCLITVTLST
ncbi:hypothetical protein ACX3X6_07090 [Pseudomonas sichuanensis]